MSRYEKTGERPTDYSKWHRTLSDECKVQDVDWVEYRIENDKPVIKAIIETGRWNKTKFVGNQIKVAKIVAEKLGVPCFFVEYSINDDNYEKNVFKVINLENEKKFRIMSNIEYSNFIIGL